MVAQMESEQVDCLNPEGSGGSPPSDVGAFERLKKEIRAILITALKDGLTRKQLERDYQDINGRAIPVYDLGCGSVDELLDLMPDAVRRVDAPSSDCRYFPVANASTKRLVSLVAGQKQRGSMGRFGGAISASCRKEIIGDRLMELLSSRPMTLQRLSETYQRKHGEPIQSQQYYSCDLRQLFTEHLSDSFEMVTSSCGEEMVRRRRLFRPTSSAAAFGGGFGGFASAAAPMQLPFGALATAPAQILQRLVGRASPTTAAATAAGVARFPAPVSFPSLQFPAPPGRPRRSRLAPRRFRLPASEPRFIGSPRFGGTWPACDDIVAAVVDMLGCYKAGLSSSEVEQLLSVQLGAAFRLEPLFGVTWRSFASRYLSQTCDISESPTFVDPTAVRLRLRSVVAPPPIEQASATPASIVEQTKEDIRAVFLSHPAGIDYEHFQDVFHETLGRPLNLAALDYFSLSELVFDERFADVVRLEKLEEGQWLWPVERADAPLALLLAGLLSRRPHRALTYGAALQLLEIKLGRPVEMAELRGIVSNSPQLFRSRWAADLNDWVVELTGVPDGAAPLDCLRPAAAPSPPELVEVPDTCLESSAMAGQSSSRLAALPPDALGVDAPFVGVNEPLTQFDSLNFAQRGRLVRVVVTQYEAPDLFYAMLFDSFPEIATLMRQMTLFYASESGAAYRVAAESVAKGLPVATPYSVDGVSPAEINRAVVRAVAVDGLVELFFVDFGTQCYCCAADLFHLRAEYAESAPAGAIHFRIGDAVPLERRESWDVDDGQRVFLQTCSHLDCVVMAVVECVDSDGTVCLADVLVSKTDDRQPLSLLDAYEQEGVARRSPSAASPPTQAARCHSKFDANASDRSRTVSASSELKGQSSGTPADEKLPDTLQDETVALSTVPEAPPLTPTDAPPSSRLEKSGAKASAAYALYEQFATGLAAGTMTVAAVKLALKVKMRQRDKRYRAVEEGDGDEDADALQLATELSQMDTEIQLIQDLVRQHDG